MLLFIVAVTGCNNNDDGNNRNPYLPDYGFSITINMEQPLYSQLNFTGNAVRVTNGEAGALGVIIVMNTGSGFVAYDGACPNQALSECSLLEINGITAVCPCDDAEYNLFNGLGPGAYPLKNYRVELVSNSVLRVYN